MKEDIRLVKNRLRQSIKQMRRNLEPDEKKRMDDEITDTFLSLDDLKPGTFGVREPDADKSRLYDCTGRPICIVPGLSFDRWGYRLGYGKGYYDRFLTRYVGWTVGLCYSECVQYKLPHGRFDKPVDRLITEKYMRLCDDNRPVSKPIRRR